MPDDVKSKISELEKDLYSKDFKQHRVEDILTHKEAIAGPSWDKEADEASLRETEITSANRHQLMKKFVKYSVLFFLLSTVVAVFIWWRGSNIVSGENILIDIVAPVAVSGGEPFETRFTITNNNKVSIESATLFVEYPPGFYSVPNRVDIPRISKKLGGIAPEQSISETVNTMLYGEENTSKVAQVVLEYRMAGSNATIKKTTIYSIKISSSPVNVKLSVPKEVSSGQEVELSIEVGSNSKDSTGAILIYATFPRGFNFISASPAPTYGENVWRVVDLSPQEKRTIKIRGSIEGQENEEKVTKILVGTEDTKDERFVGIVYNSATESSTITKPFLALDVAINNSKSQDNVVSLGKGVRVDVFWQSNNPTKFTDAVIEVKLNGVALDRYSIYASGGGYYRSIDNTIVWDKSGSKDLAVIDPVSRGTVSFSFSPVALGIGADSLIKNPQIVFEVRARANKISDLSYNEIVSTFMSRSVKFETDLRVYAKGMFFSGPFQNIGPIPPQADKETTYTISLSVRNSSNNVSNAVAKTTLPIYVKWLGKIDPEGEDISFNDSTGEVTWNVGRVLSGGTRDAAFQISFVPSVSHINRSPLLTGDITISAMDDFTKTEVMDKKPALTTYITGDPQFNPNDANVVQ
ncbi:MAG: hypothetical protein COV32_01665 [Candidatus Yonathbacteria bacterium CG10_big_fil_rev_8_21_14_0_10_43_136]|uniref:DUF11 domain-containing protein n=2 Tax=Parcubacteria group TaxID=1794811 RepID=A0A2M7Q5N9_9BACT|nr:MAG: hypothetical protein AUK15_03175 [Candidatus Nomurabacteria bacterium CG2_30_43_9]PIQ35925.1 MAG: hypothetical protein COW60_01300 [Candidatus Yonathbacteria bacterium CG17_big_fil_post_rev_8_21_14_2_50_43_9]PIR40742.1 MAG: hypothetical protein COV32_01665 [Candidatus Yonathbacteria bacterium CG10_big_fil_rev_8_21_14_0_10_43_136]PIX56929.1 MAG: hypothetical protein COZ48_03460 [Candidatus Yonathbacteria bacterium CG_4_10_14_3_um_filter_43_12]PIY58402.1 MAG: hypothetical protein COY98_02